MKDINKELKNAIWKIVTKENIEINNQNIDWLIERAFKFIGQKRSDMTEREKIIQLIKAGNEKARDYFNNEAMAILKQGKSYSSKDRTRTFDEFVADTLIENEIGDISEWKARAEVAERALHLSCDIAMKDINIIVFPNTKTQVNNKIELYNYFIQQAEKEIEEEKK